MIQSPPKNSIYKTNTAKMLIFKNHLKNKTRPNKCTGNYPTNTYYTRRPKYFYSKFGLQLYYLNNITLVKHTMKTSLKEVFLILHMFAYQLK